MKKHGFQNEEKREESYKALIREFYEEVYDWSVPETEEFGRDLLSQLEDLKMPKSVIAWCKKLIEVICEVKRESGSVVSFSG